MAYLLRPVFAPFALLVWYLAFCCLRRNALDGASGLLGTLGKTRSPLIGVRDYTRQLVPVLDFGAFTKIYLGHVGALPSCDSSLLCFLALSFFLCFCTIWYHCSLASFLSWCILVLVVPVLRCNCLFVFL